MKRQKPMYSKDWYDEFTRWEKWYKRKLERIVGKRELKKLINALETKEEQHEVDR